MTLFPFNIQMRNDAFHAYAYNFPFSNRRGFVVRQMKRITVMSISTSLHNAYLLPVSSLEQWRRQAFGSHEHVPLTFRNGWARWCHQLHDHTLSQTAAAEAQHSSLTVTVFISQPLGSLARIKPSCKSFSTLRHLRRTYNTRACTSTLRSEHKRPAHGQRLGQPGLV